MRYLNTFILCILSNFCFAQATAFTEYDLNPKGNSHPYYFYSYKGKLFFVAVSDTFGEEVWISDGTLAGSHVLKDINPGKASSAPAGFAVADWLIFSAKDSTNEYNIWRTDGTDTGTHVVKKLNPVLGNGAYGSSTMFTSYKGMLYFGAYDSANHPGLWVTNGTPVGTTLIKDFYGTGVSSFVPNELKVFNGKLYFSAGTKATGAELYVSDGTTAGTTLLKDIEPDSGSSAPYGFTEINGKLVFVAITSKEGRELWATDGTTAGTQLLKDIISGPQNGTFAMLQVLNNQLLFMSGDPNGAPTKLWSTDGTSSGTKMLKDITVLGGAYGSYYYAKGTIIYNGKLYFGAADSGTNCELWQSDGTTAGTQKFKEIYPGPKGSLPSNFCEYNGRFYFLCFDTGYTTNVFVSNGTDTGTHVVKPKIKIVSNNHGGPFWPYNNRLYFSWDYNAADIELWSLKDTAIPISVPMALKNNNSFSIYPNPNNGNFTLKLSEMQGSNTMIEVYDVAGQQVYSKEITQQVTQLQLGDMSKGMYVIRLLSGSSISSQLLTIE